MDTVWWTVQTQEETRRDLARLRLPPVIVLVFRSLRSYWTESRRVLRMILSFFVQNTADLFCVMNGVQTRATWLSWSMVLCR